MGMAGMGIGAIMHIAGTALEGKARDIARDRLKSVAKMPGLDVNKLTGEALDSQLKYLPQGMDLASQISKANQADVLGREEAALPGAGAARGTALDRILKLFSDDPTWIEGVQRRAGVLGVRSGLFGSQAGQIGSLRLSDTESQDRLTRGMGLLSALLGTLRISNSPGVENFLGPTPDKLLNIRGHERDMKQALMAQWAQMPGMTASFAQSLKDAGGMLVGAGLSGQPQQQPQQMSNTGGNVGNFPGTGNPAGVGGGAGLSNSAYTGLGALLGSGFGCWIAREVFGNDNPQWLRFWLWKEFVGPTWFRDWYQRNGEAVSIWISDNPKIKFQIRRCMESIING